jgi:hypothetical protein
LLPYASRRWDLLPYNRFSGPCQRSFCPERRWRGIGFVNLFGAVGGFLAPIIRVKAETLFASGAAGLLTLAGVAIAGALIILTLNVRQAVSHSNSVHS